MNAQYFELTNGSLSASIGIRSDLLNRPDVLAKAFERLFKEAMALGMFPAQPIQIYATDGQGNPSSVSIQLSEPTK